MNWCRNSIKVINGLQSLAAETKKGFLFFVLWLKKNGVKGDKEITPPNGRSWEIKRC